MQDFTGEEHPILYLSRTLLQAEKKYDAIEKDALAMKRAALKLKYYFLGRHFTLVTDSPSVNGQG